MIFACFSAIRRGRVGSIELASRSSTAFCDSGPSKQTAVETDQFLMLCDISEGRTSAFSPPAVAICAPPPAPAGWGEFLDWI